MHWYLRPVPLASDDDDDDDCDTILLLCERCWTTPTPAIPCDDPGTLMTDTGGDEELLLELERPPPPPPPPLP